MKSKKPTDIKSVSVDQLRDLETKTVVGASTASAQGGKTASKKAKDSAKLDNTLDKTIDDNDNDNRRGMQSAPRISGPIRMISRR